MKKETSRNYKLSKTPKVKENHYLYIVFTTVRDNRLAADPRVIVVEAEYQRRGGTGLNRKHSVVLFTTGNLYEHISGKELSTDCG